jgi:sugar/nucleoside kinase (ribokinase family)
MKIVALGTINRDTILLPDGDIQESFGGLLYSIVPLALFTEPGTEVVPVVNLGRDVAGPVTAIMSQYPQISLEGVHLVSEKNNHAILRYRSQGEREEVLEGGIPPVTFEQIAPFLDADLFLVNFISGRDLSLETLKLVRTSTMANIYMDIHSLCLGIDQKGRRNWQAVPHWREWMGQADVVQVNRGEARQLFGDRIQSEQGLLAFGREVIKAGPSVLLITLGSQGSLMIVASKSGVRRQRFSPQPPPKIRDTTGCGDVFLAAFVAQHARSGDAHKASLFANFVAGAKCGLSGIEELEVLKELAAKLQKNVDK